MSELKGYIETTKIQPALEDITITPSKQEQNFKSKVDGYDNIRVNAIPCETLNITPKREKQVFEGMYDKVNVSEIQADILNITPKKEGQYFDGLYEKIYVEEITRDDLTVIPSMKEQSFNGLYENVKVGAIETEEATIDPDFSTQDTFEVTATEGKYIIKATVNKDTDLLPGNILEGKNLYGVEGSLKIPDTSDATATAKDIAKDKTAYVNGEKIVGTMEVADYNAKISAEGITDTTFTMDSAIEEIDLTNVDTSRFTTFTSAFYNLTNLKKVIGLNTSNATNTTSMFQSCSALEELPELDTSKVTNMTSMLSGCSAMKSISLDASSATNLTRVFEACRAATEINLSNTSKATTWSYAFNNCVALTTLQQIDMSSTNRIDYIFNACTKLENIGGFLNLGKAYTQKSSGYNNYKLDLSRATLLTHDSLMNIINNLYDLNLTYNVANGGTLYTQTLVLGSTNLAKLTADEIAIATNKGWAVS